MQKTTIEDMGNKVRGLFAKAKEVVSGCVAKLKTKEGRDDLVTKAKGKSIIVRDRTLAVWKSGLKGKVALCAVALVILWIITPSCGDSGKAKSAAASGGIAKLKMKKLRNNDALFYEGTFPQGTSGIEFKDDYNGEGLYKSVAPNVIVLPDNISTKNLCAIFNPEMEDWRKKGTSYLNDPDGLYYSEVVHVARGHVIVKPSSTSMYGFFYGFIETEDEYVEGARLKLGFYTYLGTTRTVPLANGSSQTMYTFRKLDDKIASELYKAIEYNGKAIDAARSENGRRMGELHQEKMEKLAEESKAEEAARRKSEVQECEKVFTDAMKRFEESVFPRIHVAPNIKGAISVDFLLSGSIESEDRESYGEMKAKIEKQGFQKYYTDKGLENFEVDFVRRDVRHLFNDALGVEFAIKKGKKAPPCRAYIYDKAYMSDSLKELLEEKGMLGGRAELYVIGKDDDLNAIAEADIAIEDNPQGKFQFEFEKKYGK